MQNKLHNIKIYIKNKLKKIKKLIRKEYKRK